MTTKTVFKKLTLFVLLGTIGGGAWYAWQILQSDQIPEKLEPYADVINEVKSHFKKPDQLP